MSPVGGARGGALRTPPNFPAFIGAAAFNNSGTSQATHVTQPAATAIGDYVLVFGFGDISPAGQTEWPTPPGW